MCSDSSKIVLVLLKHFQQVGKYHIGIVVQKPIEVQQLQWKLTIDWINNIHSLPIKQFYQHQACLYLSHSVE